MADETLSPGGSEPSQASPAPGNESGGTGESSSEGRPGDYSGLSQQQMLQELIRRDERIKAIGRDYGASQQEALRLRAAYDQAARERDQWAAHAQSMQSRQVQAEEPRNEDPSPSYDVITPEEAKALSSAALSEDEKGIRSVLGSAASRIERRVVSQLEEASRKQAEHAAAQSSLARVIGADINNAEFVQKMLQKYASIVQDPGRSSTFKDAPIKVAGVELNANILREAALEVRSDMSAHNTAVQQSAESKEFFIEPGSRSKQGIAEKPVTRPKFDETNPDHVRSLMTEDEIAHCDRARQDVVNYFKWLPPRVKEARLKRGYPVTASELGLREVK